MSTPNKKRVAESQIESSPKRRAIDIIKKREKIDASPGQTLSGLSAKFNLPISTIQTILKNKEKILNPDINVETKHLKQAKYLDIEEALDKWFAEVKSKPNITIQGPELKFQALKFAVKLGHPEFLASQGWIENFKKRHQIVFKSNNGEAGLVDPRVCEHWIQFTLPDLIQNFDIKDIFNAVFDFHICFLNLKF